jgi:hypothetical protein
MVGTNVTSTVKSGHCGSPNCWYPPTKLLHGCLWPLKRQDGLGPLPAISLLHQRVESPPRQMQSLGTISRHFVPSPYLITRITNTHSYIRYMFSMILSPNVVGFYKPKHAAVCKMGIKIHYGQVLCW